MVRHLVDIYKASEWSHFQKVIEASQYIVLFHQYVSL